MNTQPAPKPGKPPFGGLSKGNTEERLDAIERKIIDFVTPTQSVGLWAAHGHYKQLPLALSPGSWNLHERDIVSADSIHIVGSGFQTGLIMSPVNTTGCLSVSGSSVVIENLRFQGSTGTLLNVSGSSVTIRNCWFEGSGDANCVTVTSNYFTLESCTIVGGSANMVVVANSDNAIINNNRFYPPAGFGSYGIFLSSTDPAVAANRCDYCVIVGNHMGSASVDIRYNATGNHVVTGNVGNSVAYV